MNYYYRIKSIHKTYRWKTLKFKNMCAYFLSVAKTFPNYMTRNQFQFWPYKPKIYCSFIEMYYWLYLFSSDMKKKHYHIYLVAESLTILTIRVRFNNLNLFLSIQLFKCQYHNLEFRTGKTDSISHRDRDVCVLKRRPLNNIIFIFVCIILNRVPVMKARWCELYDSCGV